MKYCLHCGNPADDSDLFCCKCGKRIFRDERYSTTYKAGMAEREREPLNKLMCELAYSGTLFWLPILVCPKERYARYHANQGLWILILSVASCTGIRIFASLNQWLEGGVTGIISNGIYSLVFMIFLFLMLFLLWSAIRKAMDVHNGEEPTAILFFEKAAIIRERGGLN